jgi:hypothetical protein
VRKGAKAAIAACVVLLAAIGGCAEMSAGDCADKGTCVPDEAGADASVDARTSDAFFFPGDARPDGATDTGADGPIDAPASDAPRTDANDADASDGATADDATPDAPVDLDASDACNLHETCVEAPPPGWSGPLARAETIGAPPPAIPACAAPYGALAFDGSADPVFPPAQCACACGGAVNVVCPDPTIDLYAGSACATRCGGASVPPGSCTAVSTGGCGGSVYAKPTAKPPTGGSCPAQPTVSVPAWHWERNARTCALPTAAVRGRCAAGEVCAPSPAPPFSGHLCIAAAGDVDCPLDSHYTVRHVDFAGASDTRGCTACTCGAPSGGTCTGTFSTYNATACTLHTNTSPLSSPCAAVPITTAALQASSPTPTGTTCAPSAVDPVGTIAPKTPTTVCCQP